MSQAIRVFASNPSMIGQTYTFTGTGSPRGHHHEVVVTKRHQHFYIPLTMLHEAKVAGFKEVVALGEDNINQPSPADADYPSVFDSSTHPVIVPTPESLEGEKQAQAKSGVQGVGPENNPANPTPDTDAKAALQPPQPAT